MTAFLWAKSLLPPTGLLDVVAAGIAAVITFAMLAAVKWILENGYSLEQSDLLKQRFNEFKLVGEALMKMSLVDLKSKKNIYEFVKRLLEK